MPLQENLKFRSSQIAGIASKISILVIFSYFMDYSQTVVAA